MLHGSEHEHKNREFVISGILKQSFTPNDDVVFMQLKTDEAMHISNEKLSKMRVQILEVEDKINHVRNSKREKKRDGNFKKFRGNC